MIKAQLIIRTKAAEHEVEGIPLAPQHQHGLKAVSGVSDFDELTTALAENSRLRVSRGYFDRARTLR